MDINQLANKIMDILRKLEKDVKQETKQSLINIQVFHAASNMSEYSKR